jgi:hypothetical protein
MGAFTLHLRDLFLAVINAVIDMKRAQRNPESGRGAGSAPWE